MSEDLAAKVAALEARIAKLEENLDRVHSKVERMRFGLEEFASLQAQLAAVAEQQFAPLAGEADGGGP